MLPQNHGKRLHLSTRHQPLAGACCTRLPFGDTGSVRTSTTFPAILPPQSLWPGRTTSAAFMNDAGSHHGWLGQRSRNFPSPSSSRVASPSGIRTWVLSIILPHLGSAAILPTELIRTVAQMVSKPEVVATFHLLSQIKQQRSLLVSGRSHERGTKTAEQKSKRA